MLQANNRAESEGRIEESSDLDNDSNFKKSFGELAFSNPRV